VCGLDGEKPFFLKREGTCHRYEGMGDTIVQLRSPFCSG
jgi:hypothetical protein